MKYHVNIVMDKVLGDEADSREGGGGHEHSQHVADDWSAQDHLTLSGNTTASFPLIFVLHILIYRIVYRSSEMSGLCSKWSSLNLVKCCLLANSMR